MSDKPSFRRNRLSHAILSTLAATAVSSPAGAQIEEVIVTATKRAESTQDIPVSVSALQGDDLRELRVNTFDDYVRFLPNVVIMGTGPGQSEIYMRGAATEQSKNTLSTVQGSSPAVALYLDEQPVSFGGRNLDVYAADLNRVEALPGPQGTLFGASSQSGTLRLITNKPQVGEFDAGIELDFSLTNGGDENNAQQAFVNVPVTDDLAVRVVAYHDRQGGWIDNIANDPDNGGYSPSIQVINRNDISAAPVNPNSDFEAADNSELVEDDFNDARYLGGRVSLAYEPGENWSILAQHTRQSLDADGVFAYDPTLDHRSDTNRFQPDTNEDDFGLTTLTLNGRMEMLDFIYTVGYLDREVEAQVDYTGYTNGGGYQVYYLCPGGVRSGMDSPATTCYDPQGYYREDTDSTRFTQEFRVSTSADNRARVTAGVFFDEQTTHGIGAFGYAATRTPDDPDGTWPALGLIGDAREGANAPERLSGKQLDSPPYAFSPEINFVNDFTRKTEQLALFGQLDFDLTPTVTASFGARWYDVDFDFKGTTNSSFLCKFADDGCDRDPLKGDSNFNNNVSGRLRALGAGTPEALNAYFGDGGAAVLADIEAGRLKVDNLDNDGVLNESDVIFRGSLDWKATDDVLVFATFGQGFRQPVTNRNAARAANSSDGPYENYRVPAVAVTDKMDNYELGVKADLLDRTLRVNATGYYSDISNLQVSRFDPSNVAFLVFIENVGDAEIWGLDTDFQWLPTPALTIAGGFSLVDSELTKINEQLQGISVPKGSELPFSPDFSGNIRMRYDFETAFMGGSGGYFSGGLSYTGESKSGLAGSAHFVENTTMLVRGRGSGLKIADEGGEFVGGNCGSVGNVVRCPNGRYVQDDYVLLDLAAGIETQTWRAELYVDNVTNKRAQINIDTLQFTPTVVTNRPRTVGMRFSWLYD